jgi:di/tricarboxylate transporter
LGGATTLIGTMPNIIVSDLLRESGFDTFQFFSFTPIGVALLFTGILFMLLVGRRLLPERHSEKELQRMETPEELVSLYRLPDNLFRLRVRRNSSLVGQTLSKAHLRRDFGLTALEIIRSPAPKPVAKIGGSQIILQPEKESILLPAPEQELREHDILVVKGEADDVAHSAAALNLGVQPASVDDKNMLITEEVGVAEILLPPRSSLLGKRKHSLTIWRYSLGTRNMETHSGVA